jgi:cation:H+ antiporter
MLINVLIFFVAGALIMKATELFLDGAVEVAKALRLQKIFIAATIVSLITTLPEFIVSTSSSYLGQAGMAVGNAIGSCVCNIGLILAVGAIIKTIDIDKKDFAQRTLAMLGSCILVLLFSLDGQISRFEAVILLVFLSLYLYANYRAALKNRVEVEAGLADYDEEKNNLRGSLTQLVFGGFLVVILARYGLVETGLNIASILQLPPIVIGLSLTALGTSLPELFTSILASRKRHGEIALGNVIGANILDLLWVIGFAALIRPLAIDRQTIVFHLPAAIFIALVMLWLGLRGQGLDRRKGLGLLSLYIIYIISLYFFIYR